MPDIRTKHDPIQNAKLSISCWNGQHAPSCGGMREALDDKQGSSRGGRCECPCHTPAPRKPRPAKLKPATLPLPEKGTITIR